MKLNEEKISFEDVVMYAIEGSTFLEELDELIYKISCEVDGSYDHFKIKKAIIKYISK